METHEYMAFAIVFIVFIAWPISFIFKVKKRFTKKECMICHELTIGKRKTRGSFVIEIFLWMLFIVPGIFYTLWRLSSNEFICTYCGSSYLKQIKKISKKAA